MERNRRRVITGKVVSTKNEKTITEVTSSEKHPLYNKNFTSTKKYRAHDEKNEAKVGDTVKIMETRPLSATKRFRLLEIVARAEEVK